MTVSIPGDDSPAARLATRLVFFIAGFALSCWAPLVPFAKARLQLNDAHLGLLLLCLGVGSILSMPLAGALVGRLGTRQVILVCGGLVALALPGLAMAHTVPLLVLDLLLFGAAVGSMDVAMNVHAVAVERGAGKALMSGFHGLFSLGCFVGAGLITGLLRLGLSPASAVLVAVVPVLVCLVLAAPRLLRRSGASGSGPLFVRPRGMVLLLGLLAFTSFLTEGGILDWTALLLIQVHGFDPAMGGIGFAVFSIAMTVGRLTGDRVVARFGPRRVMLWGGVAVVCGLLVLVLVPRDGVALAALLVAGLGEANLVPVLFSAAGRQRAMPVGLALAAVSSIGYAGVLAGPAAIGFVSHAAGLPVAFLVVAVLMLALPLASGRVSRF